MVSGQYPSLVNLRNYSIDLSNKSEACFLLIVKSSENGSIWAHSTTDQTLICGLAKETIDNKREKVKEVRSVNYTQQKIVKNWLLVHLNFQLIILLKENKF